MGAEVERHHDPFESCPRRLEIVVIQETDQFIGLDTALAGERVPQFHRAGLRIGIVQLKQSGKTTGYIYPYMYLTRTL